MDIKFVHIAKPITPYTLQQREEQIIRMENSFKRIWQKVTNKLSTKDAVEIEKYLHYDFINLGY